MQTKERTHPGIDVLNTGYGDFELRFENGDEPMPLLDELNTILAA
jgi:hypothetical protein